MPTATSSSLPPKVSAATVAAMGSLAIPPYRKQQASFDPELNHLSKWPLPEHSSSWLDKRTVKVPRRSRPRQTPDVFPLTNVPLPGDKQWPSRPGVDCVPSFVADVPGVSTRRLQEMGLLDREEVPSNFKVKIDFSSSASASMQPSLHSTFGLNDIKHDKPLYTMKTKPAPPKHSPAPAPTRVKQKSSSRHTGQQADAEAEAAAPRRGERQDKEKEQQPGGARDGAVPCVGADDDEDLYSAGEPPSPTLSYCDIGNDEALATFAMDQDYVDVAREDCL
ncbi:hypothetical protein AAL_04309 [Moelleriella libera RCEF 2490]|uniref:Uncharacterized protein n=1 Tax=Moelleriella libera RCEF 2490 TaxID=1081109 RepID=A0A162INH6_9HYPO|nr:hypothetical protein AAL_04309 [Moelleriella libera RCEF 2490]